MMQQMAMSRPQPWALGALHKGVRWGALAFASIAVPASIALAQAPASMPVLAATSAPATIEVAIAPLSEPVPAAPSLPAAPLRDDAAPANPWAGFVWTDECESACPGRGEF